MSAIPGKNDPSPPAAIPGAPGQGSQAGAAGRWLAGASLHTSRRLERLAGYFSPRLRRPLPAVGGNDLRLLINGNEAYSAMLAAILSARQSVDVEMYIWRADAIGQRFADLLKAKAREGVRVRILYDSFGSLNTPRTFWRDLQSAGVAVEEFNPVARWRRRNPATFCNRLRLLNHRDHRKILVIDGQIGFTGGLNIGDEYVGDAADPHHWRDTCIEIRGPAVARLAMLFERQWHRATGAKRLTLPTPPQPPPVGHQWAIVLDSRPLRTNHIQRAIVAAVRRARRQIEVTMAYFSPPPRLARALRRAARRGVEVTILLPSQSDVRAIYYAGRSHYAALLRAGVRIFECQRTVLHAKSIQIDGLWSTVGSYNLDLRSFRLNDEVSVLALGREFAGQMHQAFLADLSRSTRVTADQWRRRPWIQRFRERFYRLFRWWL
ncbi:MAG: cardiolipin synthase [Phycisphaerae bacterium]|nr:cardiolipin synthase [Phycisphaerae bacterium]